MNQNTAQSIARTMNPERRIGVELEFWLPEANKDTLKSALRMAGVPLRVCDWGTARYDSAAPVWTLKPDGSLNSNRPAGCVGMEVTSCPMAAADLFRDLERVIACLDQAGAFVNKRCGFHVHHEGTKYTAKRLQNLLNFVVKSESAMDKLVAPSRRENRCQWCESNKGLLDVSRYVRQLSTPHPKLKGTRACEILRSNDIRYRKLNIKCFKGDEHGTIEFRQHQGTTNFGKVVFWVAFTQAIVERCMTSVPQSTSYQNPMHNVLIQMKWATCDREGRLIPASNTHLDLITLATLTMDRFGFASDAPRIAFAA
jgi:hypothetical protein